MIFYDCPPVIHRKNRARTNVLLLIHVLFCPFIEFSIMLMDLSSIRFLHKFTLFFSSDNSKFKWMESREKDAKSWGNKMWLLLRALESHISYVVIEIIENLNFSPIADGDFYYTNSLLLSTTLQSINVTRFFLRFVRRFYYCSLSKKWSEVKEFFFYTKKNPK